MSNTASVTGDVPDPNPANNTDTADTTVNSQADLSVTKIGNPDPVIAGETLTYTLTITNNGPSDATGVTLTDDLPTSVTYVSATTGCSGISTVVCVLGFLSPNSSDDVIIVVTVDPTTHGIITNTANVTNNEIDLNTSNNTDFDDATVYTPPEANFTASPSSGTAPVTVYFTNLSTGDFDTCIWVFGDSGTSDDCNDPSHTYNAAGVYTVTLTASGFGGSDMEIKPSYIQVDHTIYLPLVVCGHQSTGLSLSRTPVLTNTNVWAIERLSALLPRKLALLFVLVSL